MVDLHSHVLPGLDDGPPDLVGSLAMAERATEEGIAVMVATPHIRADHPRVDPLGIAGAVADLQAQLDRRGIPLRVRPGGELSVTSAIDLGDEALRAVTLGSNGRDLLLETPHERLPSIFGDVVAALQRRGFRVVLAHPELNPDIQARPQILEALVAGGCLAQLTANSLRPGRRSAAGRLARQALTAGWVHAVASDSHRATWRPPGMDEARDAAGPLFSWLTGAAPAAILAGAELPPRPAGVPRPAPSRWRRRR